MKKIKINMLSNADSVDGQGVGSAYLEQVSLIRDELKDDLKLLLIIQNLLILFIVIQFYQNISFR